MQAEIEVWRITVVRAFEEYVCLYQCKDSLQFKYIFSVILIFEILGFGFVFNLDQL